MTRYRVTLHRMVQESTGIEVGAGCLSDAIKQAQRIACQVPSTCEWARSDVMFPSGLTVLKCEEVRDETL